MLNDVKDELLSKEQAKNHFGVIIDDETMKVNELETKNIRLEH